MWPKLTPDLARFIAVVAAVWLLNYCTGPLSYLAVNHACDREGGLRIEATTSVEGFWHAFSPQDSDCDACKGQVARQEFRFVEYGPVPGAAQTFVRFELAAAGSANCLPPERFETPPAGSCVAGTPFTQTPQSRYFVRTALGREPGRFGVELIARRRTIYDREQKKVIATWPYFEAGTPAERAGHFAFSYDCGAPPGLNPGDDDRFIRRVLGNTSASPAT